MYTRNLLWISFGILMFVAATFAVLHRTEKRVAAVSNSYRVEYQTKALRRVIWNQLGMNTARALVACAAFAALAIFDNPLSECWLGWNLPR